jgi:hypothetical protein
MRWWAYLLIPPALAGCRSSNDGQAPPPKVVDLATASATPSASIAPPAPSKACSVAASLTIAPKSVTSLENVRVVHASRTLVTWEDADTDPQIGDSAISANAAWIDWAPAPRFTAAELPYRAYAAAEWSRIGPTRAKGLELFTYGIAGAPSFALFDQNETVWRAIDPNMGSPPMPARALTVSIAVRESFAVAETAAIAAVGSWETPCESYYACEPIYSAKKDFLDSVRVVDLASGRSEIVWKSSAPRSYKGKTLPFAPAIAFGQTKGAVAFRVDKTMQLATLDAKFHPSAPTQIASADVGAPAVAFDGDRSVVVWAERAAPTDPYHLVIFFDGAAHAIKTGSPSAFAPSLAARDGEIVLAWMEGDAEKHGVVRVARTALSGAWDLTAAPTLSDGAGNARDPEISMQGDEAVVVWSEISTASRIQARKLACPR